MTTHSKDGADLLIHLYHRSPPRHPVASFEKDMEHMKLWNLRDLMALWPLFTAQVGALTPLFRSFCCSFNFSACSSLKSSSLQQNLAKRSLLSLSTSTSAILSTINLTTHVSASNISKSGFQRGPIVVSVEKLLLASIHPDSKLFWFFVSSSCLPRHTKLKLPSRGQTNEVSNKTRQNKHTSVFHTYSMSRTNMPHMSLAKRSSSVFSLSHFS